MDRVWRFFTPEDQKFVGETLQKYGFVVKTRDRIYLTKGTYTYNVIVRFDRPQKFFADVQYVRHILVGLFTSHQQYLEG
jgi:hypothetical protein